MYGCRPRPLDVLVEICMSVAHPYPLYHLCTIHNLWMFIVRNKAALVRNKSGIKAPQIERLFEAHFNLLSTTSRYVVDFPT